MTRAKRILLQSLWFDTLWFVAVVGRDHVQGLLALMLVLTLLQERGSETRQSYLLLFIPGVMIDLMLLQLNFYQFSTAFLPPWLLLLWLAFTWYLHKLAPLLHKQHLAIQALIGAIGGPLSYWAGFVLGAVAFPQGLAVTMLLLALIWSLLLPLMLAIFCRLEQRELHHV